MEEVYLLKEKDKDIEGFSYFLDADNGIIVDMTKIDKKELLLSEANYLINNMTTLNKKKKGGYIGRYRYSSTEELNKYYEDAWDEFGEGIIKSKTYICLKHYGKYKKRPKTYKKLLDEIEKKNYEIVGIPIEQYIAGSWNQKKKKDYITNIMIPIKEGKYG